MGNYAFKAPEDIPDAERRAVFDEQGPSVEALVAGLRSGKWRNITVLTGAGISVSAGIPDFRSPGSGLYSNLEKYNLPNPEAVFDLEFFSGNPQPFCQLAREIWPRDGVRPTFSHFFVLLLEKRGLLRRLYTQNIDGLEAAVGIPEEKLVECHGSFASAQCIDETCDASPEVDAVREAIMRGEPPRCSACGGLVKPGIVFFGEPMPEHFKVTRDLDFADKIEDEIVCRTDLVLVIGTSLQVLPIMQLPDLVHWLTPRVLVNRERVHLFGEDAPEWPPRADGEDNGFRFDVEDNYRDVFLEGDCDATLSDLVDQLGWRDELQSLMDAWQREHRDCK